MASEKPETKSISEDPLSQVIKAFDSSLGDVMANFGQIVGQGIGNTIGGVLDAIIRIPIFG